QGQQPLGGIHGLLRCLGYPVKEKPKPPFPITVRAHAIEHVVIVGTTTLEVEAEIQAGLPQHALVAKDEDDQQASEASVAVAERVDGFELHVRKRSLHQWWHLRSWRMNELFQRRQRGRQRFRRRGHE